jgi:hypothetical protein
MAQSVQVTIERGDITAFDADVIVLKFAQRPHGADRLVANQLISRGISEASLRPAIGQTRFLATNGADGCSSVCSNVRYRRAGTR